MSGGGPDDWVSDDAAGAVDIAIDGHGTVWAVNAEGGVYYREPMLGLGLVPEWTDAHIRESAADGSWSHPVKAVKIAAGENTVMVVDDQQRLWQRWHAVPGATGASWTLDTQASGVVSVAAGADGTPHHYLNSSGKLFSREGSSGWAAKKISEGTGKEMGASRRLSRLDAGVRLEMALNKPPHYFFSLFYLTEDGAMYEPGRVRVAAGLHYQDPVGRGVDFAVRNSDDIWMVNADGEIYRRTAKPFTSALAVGKPISTEVVGSGGYVWTKMKGPDFSQARIHWIQRGDTFNQIAANYGLTLAALKAKNKQVTNVDRIEAGDRLMLA
jgi:hypothetical protein